MRKDEIKELLELVLKRLDKIEERLPTAPIVVRADPPPVTLQQGTVVYSIGTWVPTFPSSFYAGEVVTGADLVVSTTVETSDE